MSALLCSRLVLVASGGALAARRVAPRAALDTARWQRRRQQSLLCASSSTVAPQTTASVPRGTRWLASSSRAPRAAASRHDAAAPPPPHDDAASSSSSEDYDTSDTHAENDSHRESLEYRYERALPFVPKHGWERAVAAAARADGLSPASGSGSSGARLALHHVRQANRVHAQMLQDLNPSSLRLVDALKVAIKTRLELNVPVLSRWNEALALLTTTSPDITAEAAREAAALCDEICFACGDRANNLTWYAHRAVVGGVYAATELYMLNDRSRGYADTWTFLDRRLDDVLSLNALVSRAESLGDFVWSAASGVVGKGVQQMRDASARGSPSPPPPSPPPPPPRRSKKRAQPKKRRAPSTPPPPSPGATSDSIGHVDDVRRAYERTAPPHSHTEHTRPSSSPSSSSSSRKHK